MANTGVSSLWTEAARSFGSEINLDFQAPDKRLVLDQVLKLARDKETEAASKRWKISRGNGKVIYLRDIYGHVATCVDKFKAIGDIACQADAGAASLPWAGVRLLLQAVVNDHERHKAVLEGVELASDLITRSAIIENLYLPISSSQSASTDQLSEALLKLYIQILKFLSDSVHHYNKNAFARLGASIVSPVETTLHIRIADMVRGNAVVHELTDYVQRQWAINSHEHVTENAAAFKAILDNMQYPLEDMRQGLSLLLERERLLENSAYLDWLSTLPYNQHHADIRGDRLRDTGDWLMHTPRFHGWRNASTSSLFWLQGLPGCGKTKVVSAVIDKIKGQDLAPSEQLSLAYIYFARDTAEKQRADPAEALRSIVRQLSVSLKQVQSLKEVYTRQTVVNASFDVPPRLTVAESLDFILGLTRNRETYVILDAMDECDSSKRNDMIRSLNTLLRAPDRVLKIFVSSRDPVHRSLEAYTSLEISPDDNFQDIERFIDTKVDEYIADGRLLQGHVSDDVKDKIVSNLKQKAQGMFLWVTLQIQGLSNSDRMIMEADVLAELSRLPESLNDLYASAYEQVTRAGLTSRHVAVATLRWLLCAQRPLDAQELLGAVTVDHEENFISISLEQIMASCRNLVVYDKKLNVLRFAHLSVRDFLEKQAEFSTSENEVVVAERCLDVVSATYSGVVVKGQKLQQNLDLQAYASTFWVSHYQNISRGSVPPRLEKKVFRFFFRGHDASNSFKRWALTVPEQLASGEVDASISNVLKQLTQQPSTPVFAACILGLPQVLTYIQQLIPADLAKSTMTGRSLMELATEFGQFEVVELLLNPSTKGSAIGPLPLTKVKAQVDNDPSVLYFIAALQAAVRSERHEVVAMLVGRGDRLHGDVRLLDYALESAAWLSDSKMVTALLANGAEARNPRPGTKFDILSQAARCGMRDLVEHLLDNGADVHAISRDGRGMSALEHASLNGHADVVTLLMDRGATIVTSYMKQCWTAFQDAVAYDDVKTLQALWNGTVKAGKADPLQVLNLQTKDRKENPLHRAVRYGAVNATKWLLDHHAEFSADQEGCTPLHRAVIEEHAEIVRLILSSRHLQVELVVGQKMQRGLTALHCAAYQANAEICKEILRHHPRSLYLLTDDDYTPLHLAAISGSVECVNTLLEIGHSNYLDLGNHWQMTALMEAIANGHPDTVAALLDHGANPTISIDDDFVGYQFDSYNPFTGGSFSALHTAVAWQERQSLKLLLDHGARHMTAGDLEEWLGKTDYWGRTALELAMDVEDASVVDILVKAMTKALGKFEDKTQVEARSEARRRQAEGRPMLRWAHKNLHPAARPDLGRHSKTAAQDWNSSVPNPPPTDVSHVDKAHGRRSSSALNDLASELEKLRAQWDRSSSSNSDDRQTRPYLSLRRGKVD